MSKAILETAVVIIGSLGKGQRSIRCRFGQDVGRFVIIEANPDMGGWGKKGPMEMEVIPGERNNGMNGTNDPSIPQKRRVFRFGSKGSPIL